MKAKRSSIKQVEYIFSIIILLYIHCQYVSLRTVFVHFTVLYFAVLYVLWSNRAKFLEAALRQIMITKVKKKLHTNHVDISALRNAQGQIYEIILYYFCGFRKLCMLV